MERSIYRSMRLLQKEHWWFRGRRMILASLIAGLGLRPGSRILEAGAGSGGNIALLQEFGSVSAFDMDEEAVNFCRLDTGVHSLVGSLPGENPYQDSGDYDLVVALDVLEHIGEDRESLVSLSSCLAHDGRILLTVPAYQWMFSGHDVIHHHKRRYTLAGLESVVGASGLVVDSSGYFNSILFPIVAAVRIGSKALSRDASSDTRMPGRRLNSLLAWIFGLEARILGRAAFPFGTSIFLIASRPASNVASLGQAN